MFPYLDLVGVSRRSILRASYFTDVEYESPGFTVQSITSHSSAINSRLRKRYGNAIPFGQAAPALLASGLNPPPVTLSGRPTLGSYLMLLSVTAGGPIGMAVLQWSQDGGVTWTTGVPVAPSVTLGTTGMVALCPVQTYDVSNVYAAASPVPEAILKWLTALVTEDVATRHGINTNDPLSVRISGKATLADAQLEEAANGAIGLFDLPTSEDMASAIDTGGPRAYSEQSPYGWIYRQALGAQRELERLSGVMYGGGVPPNGLVG